MNRIERTQGAQTLLQEVYGMVGSATGLPGEQDLNFRIEIDGETRYVLKVMHAGCEPALVALQCAMLEALNNNAGCRVAKPVRTKARETVASVQWGGETRLVWMVDYLHGRIMASVAPLAGTQLRALGRYAANMSLALAAFDHPALDRELSWNLTAAADHADSVACVDVDVRDEVASVLGEFTARWQAQLLQRPAQAIHNDINDHNVVLSETDDAIAGLIDFGDAARQPVICELAIACAYAAMGHDDAMAACCAVVAGFCAVRPLPAADLALLLPLIMTRLAVSLCVSSRRRAEGDADAYAEVSHAAAKALLQRLRDRDQGVAHVRLRMAAGLPGVASRADVLDYLATTKMHAAMEVTDAPVLDLGVGSTLLGADPAAGRLEPLTQHINTFMQQHNATAALGRYLEPRMLYQSASFGAQQHACDERRTVHLGIDVFAAAGSVVAAPLPAVVHRVTRIDLPLDYGPLVILKHQTPEGTDFYSLYGHLEANSLLHLKEGQTLSAGEHFCRVGAPPENGGWPPHLHLQLIIDDLGLCEAFPGVCSPSDTAALRALSPNPAIMLGREDNALDASADDAALIERRRQLVGTSLSLSYAEPLHIVRGFGPYLYDAQARGYLDFYNNVAHVGHSHPHVVDAVQRQVGLLNTNTRYLHRQMLDYAERLTARLPEPLEVCLFVNSASEANELALRMARQVTGRRDMMVAADAYHGHTSALIDMSPYKYNGPGGAGPTDWVHEVPVADDYRGPYKRGEADVGKRYAAHVEQLLPTLDREHACAGFIAETLPSVGGQIILPPGYLKAVYAAVRAHGGLCIADEVQTGFGRLGASFWGFEDQDVVPDMVVLGKPIANGFPMGAIVTTRAIADAFDTGMEFFATFGGNPVACAAATAVLDVVERDDLAHNAEHTGALFLRGLKQLKKRHALIGDVRGMGFFLGIELVHDHTTLTPAADAASFVVNQLRHKGLLTGIDGPLHNVVKLRPTMVTGKDDVERALQLMDQVFEHAGRQF
ncbi:MAG: aminotransferase class III-fold pyridoxal phosphate-dependent enzyme [Gammaproteobacteria bacterium]